MRARAHQYMKSSSIVLFLICASWMSRGREGGRERGREGRWVESARFGEGRTRRMTTTGKSRMSPRLFTSAPGWFLGWTFRRRNWFGIKVMNSALAALSLRDTGGIQKVRCQRLIMFAGLKPRRESLEFQKGWAAMAVLNLEWEWNIRCGGHIPGYPRTLHPLLPARAPISAEAAVDSSAHARTSLSLTSRTLHVSFPFPNATAVCLTLYTGAIWKCKETKPLWTRSPQ